MATPSHEPVSAVLLVIVLIGVCSALCLGVMFVGKYRVVFVAPHNCCTQHDSDDTQSLPAVHLNVPTRVSAVPSHYYSTAAAASVSCH